MTLRLVPANEYASKTTTPTPAPSSLAVHDSLRNPHTHQASAINTQHPLQSRLQQWSATQRSLKLNSMGRIYGPAEPIRREMELMICSQGGRFTGAKETLVGQEILNGTDTTLSEEDIFHTTEFKDQKIHDLY